MHSALRPAGRAAAILVLLLSTNTHAQDEIRTNPNSTQQLAPVVGAERRSIFSLASARPGLTGERPDLRSRVGLTSHSIVDTQRQSTVATGRSRKKKVLLGAGIGALVGLGGGVYLSQATGGDTDPWGVPLFAAIGAGVGAASGFLISLF